MKIRILCVGKIKERYLRDAVSEYEKRLRPYAPLQIEEVPDLPCPENASHKEQEKILEKEGKALLKKISDGEIVIACCIAGKMMDSPTFATALEQALQKAQGSLIFLIGGSLGLSKEVSARADLQWSFSPLTFPHQLSRLLLLEQIYRSFRILRGEPYHK